MEWWCLPVTCIFLLSLSHPFGFTLRNPCFMLLAVIWMLQLLSFNSLDLGLFYLCSLSFASFLVALRACGKNQKRKSFYLSAGGRYKVLPFFCLKRFQLWILMFIWTQAQSNIQLSFGGLLNVLDRNSLPALSFVLFIFFPGISVRGVL